MKATLKLILNKARFSEDDKSLIRDLSAELGLPFNPGGKGCRTCDKYKDQAILIYSKLPDTEDTEAKYLLHDYVAYLWRGMEIYPAMMTDEIAADILKRGFPRKFFKKLPDEISD